MKKKQYIFPVVDVALLRTKELMVVSSDKPDDPGNIPAPRRKTEVF